MMMSRPQGALKQSQEEQIFQAMSAAGVVHKFAYLKECESDFASFLGSIISMLCVLMIQLQVPFWHSPLQPVGILGRSKGGLPPVCIKFSQSKRMLSLAKTNDVTFTVLFLQRSKEVFTKGVSRAGKLRVCLRSHVRKSCRRLKVMFYRSSG